MQRNVHSHTQGQLQPHRIQDLQCNDAEFDQLSHLHSMFPHVDRSLIYQVWMENSRNIEATAGACV
jgi:hypothetical protein